MGLFDNVDDMSLSNLVSTDYLLLYIDILSYKFVPAYNLYGFHVIMLCVCCSAAS